MLNPRGQHHRFCGPQVGEDSLFIKLSPRSLTRFPKDDNLPTAPL